MSRIVCRCVAIALAFPPILFCSLNADAQAPKTNPSLFFSGIPRQRWLDPIPGFSMTRFGLPADATIIETLRLSKVRRKDRGLILWMLDAKKKSAAVKNGEAYTCPDETRGSNYLGRLFISLAAPRTNTILMTRSVPGETVWDGKNTYLEEVSIPFLIRPGYAYAVSKKSELEEEVPPVVMDLRDYLGTGRALQFALFNSNDCAELETLLAGYDDSTDEVLVYPMSINYAGKMASAVWLEKLFAAAPVRPGHWIYQVDYRGRGGCLESYNVRFNLKTRTLEGEMKRDCDKTK